MSFTKGPWHLDADGYLWGSNPNFEIANGFTVYNKADENLIVHAPEMLEALENTLTAACLPMDQFVKYLNKVELLIKKAKGEL